MEEAEEYNGKGDLSRDPLPYWNNPGPRPLSNDKDDDDGYLKNIKFTLSSRPTTHPPTHTQYGFAHEQWLAKAFYCTRTVYHFADSIFFFQ